MKSRLTPLVLLFFILDSFGKAPGIPTALAQSSQSLVNAPSVNYTYDITLLPAIDSSARAFGINNNSQVVGSAYVYDEESVTFNEHAVLWSNYNVIDLGTLGGDSSGAEDINDSGQVTGWSHDPNQERRGFIWEAGSSMQALGTLGGDYSWAYSIDAQGLPFGTATNAGGIPRAVKWLGGNAVDFQITDNSVVYDTTNNYNVGIAWATAFMEHNGVITATLGHLGGGTSNARAVNSLGIAVGSSNIGGGVQHAFRWEDHQMTDIHPSGNSTQSFAYDINTDGTIVGKTNLGAAVWLNGEMYMLMDLINPQSGWLSLDDAQAINEAGEIVGYGIKPPLNGYQAFKLTPVKRTPVLIIPDIGNTFDATGTYSNWLMHRGVFFNELEIDPLGRVYDDLIQTLTDHGYIMGKDLFVVNYDWRLKFVEDDTYSFYDGFIDFQDAGSLADTQINYSMDYLGRYLRYAADSWRADYNEELQDVDIIAHGMGGLLARIYIQSGAYGGIYDQATNHQLPKIKNFIMVGVPNRGLPIAWNPLHDNWISSENLDLFMSKFLNNSYQKVVNDSGVVQGPDYNIDKQFITFNDVQDPIYYLKSYVPALFNLVPTYAFINPNPNGSINLYGVSNDAVYANKLLLDLNDGLDLTTPTDSNSFASQTTTTVICGIDRNTPVYINEYTNTPDPYALQPFSDWTAQPATASDHWYRDVSIAIGDGVVPLVSCVDQFVSDSRVSRYLLSSGNTTHNSLMSDLNVQSTILSHINVTPDMAKISQGTGIDILNSLTVIWDPVEGFLVDGLGRRLGYSQATGVLMEIPGSQWFGSLDGFGFITDPLAGPLHLDLAGLGSNHYVMVSASYHGNPLGGAISSGFLGQGQQVNIPVNLMYKFFLPVVMR